MRSIYNHASRVVVYLGPEDTGVNEAFELARKLTKIRKMKDADELDFDLPEDQLIDTLDIIKTTPGKPVKFRNGEPISLAWKVLLAIWDRPYFTRIWYEYFQDGEGCATKDYIGACKRLPLPREPLRLQVTAREWTFTISVRARCGLPQQRVATLLVHRLNSGIVYI